MFDAQSNVALIIHARRIRELVRLEVHPGLCFVLVVSELSHYLAIDRTTVNRTSRMILSRKEGIGKDRFFSLSLSSSLLLKILSKTSSVSSPHKFTYPSSFMSRCSPHPRPSRTRQSEIFKPNISCLSMLMTKVKGSPIFTFSATWCCVGSPLKIFIVHPGIGAVACGQFAI